MTRILNDAEREQVEDRVKNEWINNGIGENEGFFKRSDGKVELDADQSPGGDIVDGEYYDKVSIVTEDEAWDRIFNSEDFRLSVEKAIKTAEED